MVQACSTVSRSTDAEYELTCVAVVGGERLQQGDYLFTAEGEQRNVIAEGDVLLYVMLEKGIEFFEE
jgi:hypothetical protein